MSVGTFTLHRFNGDEVFAVSEAKMRYFVGESCVTLDFEVDTEEEPLRVTPPDMEGIGDHPNVEWQTCVPTFDPEDFVGKSLQIPKGYDDDREEYVSIIYYYEHQKVDNSQINVIARDADAYRVQITGTTEDLNYYDGSKPPTKIVVDANFTLLKSEEPIEPVG